MVLNTRQGFPAATTLSGKSLVTTPLVSDYYIVSNFIPGNTITPDPNNSFANMQVHCIDKLSLSSGKIGCPAVC